MAFTFTGRFSRKRIRSLNPGGVMCFEMGWDQGDRLKTLAAKFFPEAEVTVLKDINGKDRILIVQMEKEGTKHDHA